MEKLSILLGEASIPEDDTDYKRKYGEKFSFEWAGKRRAIAEAQKRSTGTLRPCPEESEDWENTENLYIEGDNLEVLKLLQDSYLGAIKMIYIDPPYNTGKDFIYKDNYRDNLTNYFEQTNTTNAVNSEASGRYHTNWLNMMYPRLKLARNLLTDDGVIFISIDDNEVSNLKAICDEIFGEDNFVGILSIENNPKGRKNSNYVAVSNDYCCIYAKNKSFSGFIENIPKNINDLTIDENGNYVYPNGTFYDKDGNFHDENGNVYSQDGKLISEAPKKEENKENKEEKKVVDFDSFDTFDFMTDVSQKGDVYNVAENVVKDVDKDNEIEIVNNSERNNPLEEHNEEKKEAEEEKKEEQQQEAGLENFTLTEEKPESTVVNQENNQPAEVAPETPKKKAGRPRKIVSDTKPAEKRGRGRPKKNEVKENATSEKAEPAKRPGRPKKTTSAATTTTATKRVGRPKKIVKETAAEPTTEKRGRGRPKKQLSSILEINRRLSEEEAKLQAMRKSINDELEEAMNEMNTSAVDDKQARREELLKEIDELQEEAQDVMTKNEPESKISEINAKLEDLLEEIKKLNS